MSELQAVTANPDDRKMRIRLQDEIYLSNIITRPFHDIFLKCKSQDGSDLEENIGTVANFTPPKCIVTSICYQNTESSSM